MEELHTVKGAESTVPYVLNRSLNWSGMRPTARDSFKSHEDGIWRLMIHHIHDETFYMGFRYIAAKSSFYIYTMYACSTTPTYKYKVEYNIEELDEVNPIRMVHENFVFSIEDLKDMAIEDVPDTHYWIIRLADIAPFFVYTSNDNDHLYTVSIPVNIQKVTKIDPEKENLQKDDEDKDFHDEILCIKDDDDNELEANLPASPIFKKKK